MLLHSRIRAAVLIGSTILMLGCSGSAPSLSLTSKSGFKDSYLIARTALERGQFGKAERGYASLLRKAGPLQPRVRLEYAHALLRNGKFEKASTEAGVVASQLKGAGRSAALAVQGTADQEIARRSINKGIVNSEALQRLVAARSSFDEILKNNPEMDPLGAIALRRKTLSIEISTIN